MSMAAILSQAKSEGLYYLPNSIRDIIRRQIASADTFRYDSVRSLVNMCRAELARQRGVNDKELGMLARYAAHWYGEVNPAYRSNDTDWMGKNRKDVDNFESAFGKIRAAHAAYRSDGGERLNRVLYFKTAQERTDFLLSIPPPIDENSIYTAPAPISTTRKTLAVDLPKNSAHVVSLRFSASGQQGIDMTEMISEPVQEQEVLFPKGTRFRVERDTTAIDKNAVVLVELPPPSKDGI